MSYVWHDSYQDGVEKEINTSKYSSINEVLEESFKKFENKDSFHCMGKGFTYGELDILSLKFASYLQNTL